MSYNKNHSAPKGEHYSSSNLWNTSKEDLYKLYWKDNLSGKEIGALFKVSSRTVRRFLKQLNIKIKNPSEALKGRPISDKSRENRKGNKNHLGKKHSEQTIQKLKTSSKEYWQTPKYVQKQMKSRGSFPNKKELYLQDLLNEWVPNTFKYVGDGEFILAGKCPDYLNINGKKQLIELYGDYWHRGQNPKERIDLFKSYGYSTLVIWESELKDLPKLKEKIINF